MNDIIEFYTKPNRFTSITNEKWICEQLHFNYEFLFSIVKSILIHPIDARKEKIKFNKTHNRLFHCLNSTVDKMLKYNGLQIYLENQKLPLSTSLKDRAILSCDHHALLFASLVRNIGIPVRVRTGYSTYIVPDLAIPHWVTEIYDQEQNKWIIVDPERQFCNVEKSQFKFAAETWLENIQHGKEFPGYSGFTGRQGLKYALICDLNSIFKNELLSYEWRYKGHNRKKPSIIRTSYERLSPEDQKRINVIAELMLKPEDNLNELWQLYASIVEPIDLENSGFFNFPKPYSIGN